MCSPSLAHDTHEPRRASERFRHASDFDSEARPSPDQEMEPRWLMGSRTVAVNARGSVNARASRLPERLASTDRTHVDLAGRREPF